MNETLRKDILSLSDNGILTSKAVSAAGYHRSVLSSLCQSGDIVQCSRGIYMLADEWEDEFAVLQKKYQKGIFSHATALYLHGYSERVPFKYELTFPSNYNCSSLKSENVNITRVINENYGLGLVEVKTPSGNTVYAYDIERCLCDLLKGNNNDIQTIQYAMKKYVLSKDKDVNKLMKYANQLRVTAKVRRYLEVLL